MKYTFAEAAPTRHSQTAAVGDHYWGVREEWKKKALARCTSAAQVKNSLYVIDTQAFATYDLSGEMGAEMVGFISGALFAEAFRVTTYTPVSGHALGALSALASCRITRRSPAFSGELARKRMIAKPAATKQLPVMEIADEALLAMATAEREQEEAEKAEFAAHRMGRRRVRE